MALSAATELATFPFLIGISPTIKFAGVLISAPSLVKYRNSRRLFRGAYYCGA